MIPFHRPPKLSEDERIKFFHEINIILDSGMLSNGEKCRKLEDTIKKMYHSQYAFTCGSGSIGLWIGLQALQARKVYLPSFTWKSLAIIIKDLKKEYLDIDHKTWLPFSPINYKNTDVFITNHTFGNITEHYDRCLILNDHACSIGARINKINDISVFSLYPTKNLTTGEGGIILTNNNILAKRIEEIRNTCSKMSEIQALLGLKYLNKLNEYIERKKQIYNYYRKHLPFQFQKIDKDFSYCYIGCLIENRDEIVNKIKDKMEIRIRYEPIIDKPKTDILEITHEIYSKILLLPSYEKLNEKRIVDLILG